MSRNVAMHGTLPRSSRNWAPRPTTFRLRRRTPPPRSRAGHRGPAPVIARVDAPEALDRTSENAAGVRHRPRFTCRSFSDLREDRRWRLLLLRQTYLWRLAVVPLEGEVRGAHAELTGGDLLEVVVAGADPELHGVERILEPNRDAHVVAIELLSHCDVGHLHRRESTLL